MQDSMTARNLLLIDDEPAVATLLERAAVRHGFAVVRTSDAKAFRKCYSQREHQMIMLDLHMPQKDGIELMRFLADRHCTARIIIVSGLDRRILETATRLGTELGLNMAAPLSKPFRSSTVDRIFEGLASERAYD